MRRLPFLVLALATALTGVVLAASSASALTAPRALAMVKGSRMATSVTIQWAWSSRPASYDIQVAQNATFTKGLLRWSVKRSATKPPGGLETKPLRELQDASRQYIRIRAVKGSYHSGWSSMTTWTLAKWPSEITAFSAKPGPGAGETTFTWKSAGDFTDYYRLDTALSPFSLTNPDVPDVGRDPHTFILDKSARSFTMTAAQTAEAGAGVGVGWHLMTRLYAVRKGNAATQERAYPNLTSAQVKGQPPAPGTPLRVGSFNLRLASLDTGTSHDWTTRTPLIADVIKQYQPAVMSLQEMVPSSWAGPGNLQEALAAAGLSRYQMTRETSYGHEAPVDARILYDTTKLEKIDGCGDVKNVPECEIDLPQYDGDAMAPYARFRDIASGKTFWFVGFHMEPGSTESLETLRQAQALAMVQGMDLLDVTHDPIIVAGDSNTYQNYLPKDAGPGALPDSLAHDVLIDGGYYDTASAVATQNMAYDTANHFERQSPDPLGFGSRLDLIATKYMPGCDRFVNHVVTSGPFPSDHNMIVADLQLP